MTESMFFRRISDGYYVSGDGRFEVVKESEKQWLARYRLATGRTERIGLHQTRRQAIEHCNRDREGTR